MRVCAFININRPWIAWLTYRGEMVSREASDARILSVWHAGYLLSAPNDPQRTARLRREMEIEAIRRADFPHAVSRLSGLYFFEDSTAAARASEAWDSAGFREDVLAEVELVGTPRISKHDAEWITRHLDSSDPSWIRRYLAGDPTDNPTWELLVEGRGFILGTDLRQRAYDTVKSAWPRSLALLELSRVAVELGSDLGFIAPIATVKDGWCDLKLYLDFRDATSPGFLEKFGKYVGPKNAADLNATSDLVVPDLSDHTARFQLSQ